MASDQAKTRSRIPNKTQWALRDILDECAAGRQQWSKANDIAEKRMDLNLLLHLSRLRHALDAVERRASDALNGEYRD
jgi:hypothetical protein